MKILVFDTESNENDIYDIVSNHLDINFINVKTEEDFLEIYESISTDSFIDVTDQVGETLFHYITDTNPKQKILVLSKTLSYNLNFTCNECAKLFNRKLLLKPINVGQLIAYIKNFDDLLCKYSSDSNEIIEIMNEILKQFIYYSYDKDKKMIILKNGMNPNVREIIRIIELLNNHNIRYVMENDNIKLYF